MPRTFRGRSAAFIPFLLILGGVRLLVAQTPYGAPVPATARLRGWDADSILVARLVRPDEQEIAYARAALPTLVGDEVTEFARGLIADLSTREAEIAPLAGRFHVPMLGATLTGYAAAPVTDSLYLTQMIARHQRLLATLPIAGIQDDELRQQVLDTRQGTQQRLDRAMAIQARQNGGS